MMKEEKKSQKLYLTDCNSLTAQSLWQAYYQILLLTLLTEFMKLNINSDTIIKSVNFAELNIKIATTFLNTQILKTI